MTAPEASDALAFVIGLEAGYRGAPLEADLRRRGFEVRRSPGVLVDSSGLQDQRLYSAEGARVVMRRPLTHGELGCALAHRDAARALLASGASAALICEDDARLTAGWNSADLPWEELGLDPAIVSLFSHGSRTVVRKGRRRTDVAGAQLLSTKFAPIIATAYMLNRAAAEILAEERPIVSVSDWDPHVAARTHFMVTYPWLAHPAGDVESTLEHDRQASTPIDGGSVARKVLRHVLAATHLTWFRFRRHYAFDYRAYRVHEFDRILVLWRAKRRGVRLLADDLESPLLL